MRKKLVALTVCIALCCTACGDKKAEEITDYGVNTAVGNSSEQAGGSTDTGTSATGTTEAAVRKTGELPEIRNGGDPIWEDNFSIGNVPAEISINHVAREMDHLHSYKMRDIAEDQIREEEVVKNVFGDTAKEVKREVSKEAGDGISLVGYVQGLYGNVHPEANVPYDGTSAVPAWEDGTEMFYHTYEGTYLDVPYYLNISYDSLSREKEIAIYPKNPGDLVGNPKCTSFEPISNHIEGINTEIWSGVNLWEAMKEKPNRTQSTHEQLTASVKNFAEGTLRIPVSEEDMKIVMGRESGDPVQREIFFYNEESISSKNTEDAVLDGYDVQLDMLHTGTSDMRFWLPGNNGDLWVSDKGVMAGYYKEFFEIEEEVAEQVRILEFDNLMDSVRELLKNEFDPAKINGQKLTINSATLMYYPVESETDPHEYTLVPAWSFTVESNGTIAYLIVNAVDGSKLLILYTQ